MYKRIPSLLFGMLTFLCLLSFFFSCSSNFLPLSDNHTIKITTYNVQTFFDAVPAGSEYADFKGAKTAWTEEKYKARIKRLCSLIDTIDSDIFVFQEIENALVLQDICNNLKLQSNAARVYSYAVFVPSKNGVLGCAVLSRFPIHSCTSHQVDYRHLSVSPPDMRPLLEVTVDCGFSSPVTIFAGHWKSKADSDKLSDFWRLTQERVLSSRILQQTNNLYIFCGDCNKDITEFTFDNEQVLLGKTEISVFQKTGFYAKAVSPWLLSDYEALQGSYYYQKRWEKIDHFFIGSDFTIESFSVENTGDHVNTERIPVRYTVWNGEGYSDHLPLTCILSEKKN